MSSPWRFDLLCLLARFRSRSLMLLTTTADLEGEVVQGVHARIRTFGQLGPDPLPPITTLLRDLRPTLPGSRPARTVTLLVWARRLIASAAWHFVSSQPGTVPACWTCQHAFLPSSAGHSSLAGKGHPLNRLQRLLVHCTRTIWRLRIRIGLVGHPFSPTCLKRVRGSRRGAADMSMDSLGRV
jgi:hypothetical protein